MSFEDILNQWEGQAQRMKRPKTQREKKHESEDLSMNSFLDMYPPTEGSGETPAEKKTARQKRRNYRRMKAQEVLDLHGFSIISAEVELDDFIKLSRKRRLEKVLIIHGKGLHSPDGEAVLRIFVRDFLRNSPYVGETGHPSEKEGGAGATWAVLRY